MNTPQTILTINLIIEKLRKHLSLCNFHEHMAPVQYTSQTQKLFALDAITAGQPINVNLAVQQQKNIFDDAWLIKILDMFFSETLMIDMYTLKINFLGCPKDQEKYNKTIAKGSKKSIQLLDVLCPTCQQERQSLIDALQILSLSFIIDPALHIPGNNNNKTQFEFSARSENKTHSLAHGNQVDLVESHVNVTQAQINIDAILKIAHTLTLPPTPVLHVIVPLNQAQNTLALLMASILRHHGKCVDIVLNFTTPQERLEHAAKMGAQYLLLLGDDEQKTGTIVIKNVMNGTQETVRQTHIIENLR